MRILYCYVIGVFATCGAICEPPERIYFDSEEMPMGEDAFHIHTGGNEWIQTSTVHRDVTGFFTYAYDVKCDPASLSYEKAWKCPYCNLYWPWGKPCGNAQCPGKFRG